MKFIALFYVFAFGISAHAIDYNWRGDLLKAIQSPRGCNQENVERAVPYVDSDDEIIFEEIKNLCLPKKSKFRTKATPEHYNKAINRYFEYVQKYLSDAESQIKDNKVGMESKDEQKIIDGLKVAGTTVKFNCATPEFKDIEVCKDQEKAKTLSDILIALDEKNGKLVVGRNIKKHDADTVRTGKVINQVSKPKDWDWNWKLTQIVNGYAVFKNIDGGADYVTAVKKSSIKNTVYPGSSLSSSVDCVKYVSDQTWEDDKGFPMKAKVYTAVACPK